MSINNGSPIPAAYADEVVPRKEQDVSTQTESPTIRVHKTQIGEFSEAVDRFVGRQVPNFETANRDDPYPVPRVFDDFEPAPDLDALAVRLIAHHESLELRIRGAQIKYAWKQKGGESQGARTLGKCVKLSGVNKYLGHGYDYLIWLAADHCAGDEDEGLEPFTYEQVEALLFHELNHIDRKYNSQGGFSWGLRTHDVEMFNDEVTEYGLWRPDLERTAQAFRQLELDGVK